MKALFQAIGTVVTGLIVLLATIILLYLSYIIAIGLVIGFLIYVVYTLISTSSETLSDSQSAG